MSTPSFSLTPRELADFDRDGFVGPFTLYSPEEMKAIHRQVRAELFNRSHAPYEAPVESAISNYDRHLDIPLLSRHVCQPGIVGRLRGILGENILCWRSEFIPKAPGAEGTDWHQADTFGHASGDPQLVWPADEDFGGCINVWTAFTEATEENGCLQFVPGTHRKMYYDESTGLEYRPELTDQVVKENVKRGFGGYDYRSLQKDPDWKPDESEAVSMVMSAGQFIIFRSMLLHASKPNITKDVYRLGYVARYVPSRVKVYPDTDMLREFGGQISLERYGTVVVSGPRRDSIEPTPSAKSPRRAIRGVHLVDRPHAMEPSTSSDGLWLGSDHIGYATRNTDATVRFLEAMGFSLQIYKRKIEKFGVYVTKLTSPDGVVMEVIEPAAEESVVSQMLSGREATVYHSCFRTTDFHRAVSKAKAEGAITVTNPMTIPYPIDEEHSRYLATHMYHPYLGLFEITGPSSADDLE